MSLPKNHDSPPIVDALCNEAFWAMLYSFLFPVVRKFVYSCGLTLRWGEVEEIVNDLVQDAILHIFKYMLRVRDREAEDIASTESFSYVIALNCCRDWRRKERHFTCQSLDDYEFESTVSSDSILDPEEIAVSLVYEEEIFIQVAESVAELAPKTQRALLIDLADLMAFNDEPTPLQRTFLQQGIEVADYRGGKPADPKMRARHSSLLSQAYKRLASLSYC